MRLTHIYLKNFRCFKELSVAFHNQLVLIKGDNGVGKTSLLEALHYACYLRSFRTFSPKELLHFQATNFFIKIRVQQDESDIQDIQIGFARNQRLVKINQKTIGSYKELLQLYRIVTLTEDDLLLIRGAPEYRRSFIDQCLILTNTAYGTLLQKLRAVVENRHALLKAPVINEQMYRLWTEQLIQISVAIKEERIQMIATIEKQMNELIQQHCQETLSVACTYKPKEYAPHLEQAELYSRRSLFGAHLDDFSIALSGVQSRGFASRGQQKLLVILAKIAQARLVQQQGESPVILVDDFMTDLDSNRIRQLITALLTVSCQTIFTCPVIESPLMEQLKLLGAQEVSLTD